MKGEFLHEIRNSISTASTSYSDIYLHRLASQTKIKELILRGSRSDEVIFDGEVISSMKKQFMEKTEEVKSELTVVYKEINDNLSKVNYFLKILSTFVKVSSATQLITEIERIIGDDSISKEQDIIEMQFNYFRKESAKFEDIRMLSKDNLPVSSYSHSKLILSVKSDTNAKENEPTRSDQDIIETDMLEKYELLKKKVEQLTIGCLDNTKEKSLNIISGISQIEFDIGGSLEDAPSDLKQVNSKFMGIIEDIIQVDGIFYKDVMIRYCYYLVLNIKSLYNNKLVISTLLVECLDNLVEVTKGASYLKSFELSLIDSVISDKISYFIKNYRIALCNVTNRNLNEFLLSMGEELNERKIENLLVPNYKRALLAADIALESINLYLDDLKIGKNKHWLTFSISSQYMPRVVSMLSPFIEKIVEYRYYQYHLGNLLHSFVTQNGGLL